MTTGRVLCSTPYYLDKAGQGLDPAQAQTHAQGLGLEREQLLHLALSDCDDVLVGGYDSGLVRVWIVALANLAVLVAQDNKQQTPAHAQAISRTSNQDSNQDNDDDGCDDDDHDGGGDEDESLAHDPLHASAALAATAIAPLVLATSWQVSEPRHTHPPTHTHSHPPTHPPTHTHTKMHKHIL